jgi:hypothetical protein
MDKWQNLNYFVAGAWSRTDPNQNGMFNDFDRHDDGAGPNTIRKMVTPSTWEPVTTCPDSQPFKVGAEYNYGSEVLDRDEPGA